MFKIGKISIRFYLFYIILLVCALQTESSAYCVHDQQYYDSEKKQCLPCKNCTFPSIVIATCKIYKNTQCGFPSFNGGPYDVEVVQERSYKHSLKRHGQNKDSNSKELLNNAQKDNNDKSAFKKGSKKFRRKLQKTLKKKKSKSKIDISKSNSDIKHLKNSNLNLEESVPNFNTSNDHNLIEENVNPLNESISSVENNDSNPLKVNFFYSYLGKVIISSIVIAVNLLLILVLIVKIIKTCHRKKSKEANCIYSCNQKLPHPSQKPIKCRFTAVLPTKSSDYANVDSYSNSLLSPTCSSSNSTNWNNSCTSGNLSSDGSRERAENSNQIPLSEEREIPEGEPLLSTQEMVESPNTMHMYSRIPSPNPFTMDRLLEQRRAVGSSSVENNLYVETWCSSPSPMLPRSQGSSVAPSPALSCIRKPFSSSNSSSPLTTRTFRATPAFTSFHPNRS